MNELGQRARALDVMRGMTLALMIVVNMSISETQSYGPLLHATWNGLTLTDVVFPSFLFVVGAALSFTLERYQRGGNLAVVRKVASRTAIIFCCGFLLYWFPFFAFDASGALMLLPLENARIPGVLQRVALCYGIAALLIHFGRSKGLLLFSAVALLLNWWLLVSFGDDTLGGNAALKLDRWLLGEAHLYKGEGIPFDPEGVLGTLPATVNVLAGYMAGQLVRRLGPGYELIARLMLLGSILVLVALSWHGVFPFNKKLWTSSYVLICIGIDLGVLAMLVFIIDMYKADRAAHFFEVFGRNTLAIYLFAEILMSVLWLVQIGEQPLFLWIFTHAFQGWAGDKPGSLVFALVLVLGCWLLGYTMDKRGIYIRA
jgi:predicted acyltransferase